MSFFYSKKYDGDYCIRNIFGIKITTKPYYLKVLNNINNKMNFYNNSINNLYDKINDINKKINDVNNQINYINENNFNKDNVNFNNIYYVNKFEKPIVCTSQLCNQEFFGLPLFQYWSNIIIEYWNDYIEQAKEVNPHNMPNGILLHRKLWEFIYIIQALYENGCLKEGKKGLGFGVGTEILPSLFASMGCEILATDLDYNTEEAKHWLAGGQNTQNNINLLNKFKLCSDEIFNKNVSFIPLNMNNIPETLKDFDFNWSSCALEHIGGLENSINFLIENLKTLKSGGIAVHTTEYNLSSNTDTLLDPNCVIFREKDIKEAIKRLEKLGHYVYPLDLREGTYIADNYVDIPPYYKNNVHLRLQTAGYKTTSIGLIIRKK